MESVLDPRDTDWAKDDIGRWRIFLRFRLITVRGALSDKTKRSGSGFDIHEGLVPRRIIPKSVRWHWMIFSSINCMLLLPEEHIPFPPSRTESYWMACVRHGKEVVDAWFDGLPWKVAPEKPWRKTHGLTIIEAMRNKYPTTDAWEVFYLNPRARLELEKDGEGS